MGDHVDVLKKSLNMQLEENFLVLGADEHGQETWIPSDWYSRLNVDNLEENDEFVVVRHLDVSESTTTMFGKHV